MGGWCPPASLLGILRRAQERGAIGPGDCAAHARHATGFLAAAERATEVEGRPWVIPSRFLDLGTGGGLPGLVLAVLLPSARGTLLDGRIERGRLLEEHVAMLGWSGRIEVVSQRAEVAAREPSRRGAFNLVVARGFGPPPVTAECAAAFLAVGGLLVVSEPPADDPARWPRDALATLGIAPLGSPVTVDVGLTPARFQVLRQVERCPDRWPRRNGIPAKRPLY